MEGTSTQATISPNKEDENSSNRGTENPQLANSFGFILLVVILAVAIATVFANTLR
jgi:hypothetical protein